MPEKVNSGTIYTTTLQSDLIHLNDSTLYQIPPSAFCRICKASIDLKRFAELVQFQCQNNIVTKGHSPWKKVKKTIISF